MPSWIGTSRVASENGIGLAAAPAALAGGARDVLLRFLRLPIGIDLLRGDEGSVDAFRRNVKGGIEDFLADRTPAGR